MPHRMMMGIEIPEYVDPSGRQIEPWPEPFIASETVYKHLGVSPEHLAVFIQPDDSNAPAICKGDLCFVDLSDVQVRDGQRYLIQHRSGARVRRVFVHHTGGLLLVPESRDRSFRPENVPAGLDLHIVGRVIFRLCF